MIPLPVPIKHVASWGVYTAPPPLPFMHERPEPEVRVPIQIMPDNPVNILRIQTAVAEAFQVPLHKLLNRGREGYVILPRHVAMFLCRELTGCTLAVIGREFGNRDHGTVMYACESVRERMDTEPKTRATVQALMEQLKESKCSTNET